MARRSGLAATVRGITRALQRADAPRRAGARRRVHALALPARAAEGGCAPPIVLLPGFCSSSRVLLPLERHLRRSLGRPVIRISLGEPLHLADVRASAERVARELDAIAEAWAAPFVDVVGHSLGGLVATYLLKCLDRGRRIRRVVTLGTPHRGTPLAILGAVVFGAFSGAIWQMIPGAPLLRELARLPVPASSEIVALASRDDGVVPPRYARLAGGSGQANRELATVGHLDFLWSEAAFRSVQVALA